MPVESFDARHVDEAARTEVRAYGTGDVHQSRDDQLQDLANNGLHRMLLDTGANRLNERVDADGSTYNVIYQAVLHEWRQRTRDMHMRGVFKVRPGLPDRTFKKRRVESQRMVTEHEFAK